MRLPQKRSWKVKWLHPTDCRCKFFSSLLLRSESLQETLHLRLLETSWEPERLWPRNWCKEGRKLLDTSGVFGLQSVPAARCISRAHRVRPVDLRTGTKRKLSSIDPWASHRCGMSGRACALIVDHQKSWDFNGFASKIINNCEESDGDPNNACNKGHSLPRRTMSCSQHLSQHFSAPKTH